MNHTLGNSSTWKNARNRYIVGAGGVALALSIAIGGISALPSLGSREASVSPQFQSRPQTLFGTMSDAELAAASTVFAAPVSQYFDEPLSPVVSETLEGYFGPGETRQSVGSQYFDRPLSPVAGETRDAYFGVVEAGVGANLPLLTPEAEILSTGVNPGWATTLADRPVTFVEQPLTSEAELLSSGYSIAR